MMDSFFYIILAGLGLSFLVFIHELGHYVMARRAKMRVEVFSIGFGKPIYTWKYNQEKWQICFILFGGYVKIAGMEKEGKKEPHEIKDGFYGKTPLDRILVAVMGPLVNIVFAALLFTAIWAMGGRTSSFGQHTKIIGYVDPASPLAEKGVKPGDLVTTYNGKPFQGPKDLLYSGVLKENTIDVSGEKVNYLTGKQAPFDYKLNSYYIPEMVKGMRTIGILSPANYIIFDGFDEKYGQFSPANGSGIAAGDRVVWANGEFIFSTLQLQRIVNQDSAFLTVKRDDKIFDARVPLVPLGDLHLSADQKDEYLDWKRALGINDPVENLFTVPYEIDSLGYVSGQLPYIDNDLLEESAKSQYKVGELDLPLQVGDQILAVYGEKVSSGLTLFDKARERKVAIIVQKPMPTETIKWQNEDEHFIQSVNWPDLALFAGALGTDAEQLENGQFKFIKPIVPLTYKEFLDRQKGVHEPSTQDFSTKVKYLFLGTKMHDQAVIYNPNPLVSIKEVLFETYYTLTSLVKGSLSPKWLSGPIGIVRVMHETWKIGIKEALYWLALISLNLGIFNLLPIPVLDGGHITFSLWELITRKRISNKTMEKLILPFVVLLIMFFIYVTYQDITRLFIK